MSLAAVKDAISASGKSLGRDLVRTAGEGERLSEVLRLGPSIDAVLPDGGLPRSAVVELASPLGLAGATSFAVQACIAGQRGAGQREAGQCGAQRGESVAWCAWIDPWSTLHAPGLRQRGVELERLLVVRPPVEAIARTAVRVATSKAFALVAIDLVPPLGLSLGLSLGLPWGLAGPDGAVRLDRWINVVRRLALAVEDANTTVLLLTDGSAHRALPLPVALRLELDRGPDRRTRLRVAKDRHGRLSGFVPLPSEETSVMVPSVPAAKHFAV